MGTSSRLKYRSSSDLDSAIFSVLFQFKVNTLQSLLFRFDSGSPKSNFSGSVSIWNRLGFKSNNNIKVNFESIFVAYFFACFNGFDFLCIFLFCKLYLEKNFAVNLVGWKNKNKPKLNEV